jgi:glycosyltransferase involved in cell wall biosynthesis
MRILHVVQSLGMGGQERLILNLARALAKRGHEVAVASLTPGGELRPEFVPEFRVYDVTRKSGFDALIFGRMARTISEFSADAVHTHNPSPMLYAVPAARALRIKRIVHTKHGANVYGPRSLHAARVVARAVTAFVAVSEGTADTARMKERVPKRLLHVIPNGIPLDDFAADPDKRARVRAELGIPRDAFVVGTVGRLAPEKDYPLLVRAMAPLLSAKNRLVIVGEGPSRPDILAAIAEHAGANAPFVVMTGSRRDIPDLLTAFDVFTLTSKTEGLPLAIPEAMASSLPIVATAVGGIPSIVPAEVGILAPNGDADALRRAFEVLASDDARRRAMGTAAHRHAHERFSLARMVDQYEVLYS